MSSNARTFGPDRAVGSVRLMSAVVQLKTNALINLPSNRYFMFKGSAPAELASLTVADSPSGLLSFFSTVFGAIGTGASRTMEVEPQHSMGDLDRSCTRIRFRALDGSGDPDTTFGIKFSGSTNFSPLLLGFPEGTLATPTPDAQGWIYSPFGVFGLWCSTSEHGGRARLKEPGERTDKRWSSGIRAYATPATWSRWNTLRLEWGYIPGATVHPQYAQDPLRAKWGGVPVDSPTQNFLEIWRQLGDGLDVLLVHDLGQASGLELVDGATQLLHVLDGDWSDFDSVARPMRIDARDQYLISLPPLWVKGGSYGY